MKNFEDSKYFGYTDKGTDHSYAPYYQKLIENFEHRDSINLLELGISKGGCVCLFKDCIKNANIYGLDIDEHNQISDNKIYNQCPENWDKVTLDVVDVTDFDKCNGWLDKQNQKFDIIIDDASHMIEDQLTSFEIFYPHLKEDGIYIIEDIQNYDVNIKSFDINLKPFNLFDNLEIKIFDLRSERPHHPYGDNAFVLFHKSGTWG